MIREVSTLNKVIFPTGYKDILEELLFLKIAKRFLQRKSKLNVRPDMRYCSRSRCSHPDPGTKHISVPPRHMKKPYAPDFQHDITTLQLHGYNISYNRLTIALICLSTDYNQMPSGKDKIIDPHNHTGPGSPQGSA